MVNSEFVKDLTRRITKESLNQELPPGSTSRRYEPEGGLKRHNERIHRESKYTDDNKNLPFSFRKPLKPKGNSTYVRCDNCGHIISATTATVGIICNECKKFSSVTEVELDG